MKGPPVVTALREALARGGRVAVRVALDSGPCWAYALKLEARGRVRVDLAGVRAVVAADRITEVSA